MHGSLKLLAIGAVVVGALAYIAPAPYTLSNPPPSPVVETVGERADRVCSREYAGNAERIEWCKNAVLLQAVADREAAKERRVRQETR